MSKQWLIVVALVGFFLTGCAEYWYQDGKTFEQCRQARQDCFEELQKRTDFVGSGDYEFKYMTECMKEKGYRLKREGDLPLDVKRMRPESSLHWRAKGVAGPLGPPDE